MKALLIKGCKDCPYAICDSRDWNLWSCSHGEFPLLDGSKDGLDTQLPETPHPDCRLPDLPTQEEIKSKFDAAEDTLYKVGVFVGSEFVINRLEVKK